MMMIWWWWYATTYHDDATKFADICREAQEFEPACPTSILILVVHGGSFIIKHHVANLTDINNTMGRQPSIKLIFFGKSPKGIFGRKSEHLLWVRKLKKWGVHCPMTRYDEINTKNSDVKYEIQAAFSTGTLSWPWGNQMWPLSGPSLHCYKHHQNYPNSLSLL